MIDMHSGDTTCILSTLEFLCNLAMKCIISPIMTFQYFNLACWLFSHIHEQLRAIGTLMPGSWPTDILEVGHGENAMVYA